MLIVKARASTGRKIYAYVTSPLAELDMEEESSTCGGLRTAFASSAIYIERCSEEDCSRTSDGALRFYPLTDLKIPTEEVLVNSH